MRKKPLQLNIGCGETKLDGFVNIDAEKSTRPDLLYDIVQKKLPFKDKTVSLIHCIHNIEHIELKFWPAVLADFWRVLKPNGELRLAYPEFAVCAKYFLTNKRGMKEFWRATLYGRQLYPGDYHITPVVTKDLIELLFFLGFDNVQHAPEPEHEYNTFLRCFKGKASKTKEDLIRETVFKR